MYSREQRIKAVELYVKYGLRSSKVISELGYPNRGTLRLWHKDYLSEIERDVCPHEEIRREYDRYLNAKNGLDSL